MTTVASSQAAVERIWSASFQSEWDEGLRATVRQAAVSGVKRCLEDGLRAELTAHLGFERDERQADGERAPEGQRSGSFKRRVETDHGTIPDLRVPKVRRGNRARVWQILTRYQRCRGSLVDTLLSLYVLGRSLRDLQEGLSILFGAGLSRSAITQITVKVQAELAEQQQQPIEASPAILIVDGVWVKILSPRPETWVDQAGHTRQRRQVHERVILVAGAVWPDGRWQLLHSEIAEAEDEAHWEQFWQHLRARGLDPAAGRRVVSDGTKGVLAAMGRQLPAARRQRCTVHKVRGFERSLPYRDLPSSDPTTPQPLSEEAARAPRRVARTTHAHEIFKAPTRTEAERRLADFRATWAALAPAAVRNFTWGLTRCFVFYDFDQALQPLIHSTHRLERFFREVRAKADEIGAFPNQLSCLTVFHLIVLRDHAKQHRPIFAKNS